MSERPHLLHLTSYAYTPRSHPGIHRMIRGLAPSFRSLVLCSDRAPYHDAPLSAEERAAEREAGIESAEIEFVRLRKPGQIAWLAAGIRRRGRPVALLAHLGNNGWRALPLARALDVPVITVFHGNDASVDLRDPEYVPRYRCLAAAPGAAVRGVSGNIALRLVEFGFAPERSRVHHLGVDLERYDLAARGDATGALELVLAGRLVAFKGHRVALDALAAFLPAHAGSRLHLYGDGPLEAELRGRARELGVEDAVVFHGVVPVAELRKAFAEADLALQPSVVGPDGRSEGVPNTVLEALATGLPVIGTRHAGIPEAVVDGETGLLALEHDAAGLAAAMERLAADPALRRRLGTAGRALVEREFDATRQGERLAVDVRAVADAYRRIPAAERRRAFWEAAKPLIEPPADHGLRYRAAWLRKTWVNRLRGEIR